MNLFDGIFRVFNFFNAIFRVSIINLELTSKEIHNKKIKAKFCDRLLQLKILFQ